MTDLEIMLLSTISYSISFDGTAFFCRFCGRSSTHPSDVENKYCGHCYLFHDNLKLEEHLKTLAKNESNT